MQRKIYCFLISFLFISFSWANATVFKNPYNISSLQSQNQFYQEKMAHPALTINTFNIDAKKQVLVKFSDLFTDEKTALKILSTYCQIYFTKKISAESMPKENFAMLGKMIKAGIAPKLENYRHWNVDGEYLKITFDEAQVLPRYYGVQTVDVPLSLLAKVLNDTLFPNVFQLHIGDLLFQDLQCGELCDGINSTTYGVGHTVVSHVGMVVSVDGDQPQIIEAINQGVTVTPLDEFLLRSEDTSGHPRVMAGRVDDQEKTLVPAAIKEAMKDLSAPYNATFSPHGPGFYCSQLIIQSFLQANHDNAVFATYPMNFKEEKSHTFPKAWVDYFAELQQSIPQGQPGSNPGQLSRDPHIDILYFYGDLRPAIS